MKLFNTIIGRFGWDKVLHFAFGGWIVSLASPFGWYGILVGFILATVFGFFKEAFFDEKFDKKDILAGMLGGVLSALLYLIIFFII